MRGIPPTKGGGGAPKGYSSPHQNSLIVSTSYAYGFHSDFLLVDKMKQLLVPTVQSLISYSMQKQRGKAWEHVSDVSE